MTDFILSKGEHALRRFEIVAMLKAHIIRGHSLNKAIDIILEQRQVSRATLYRWYVAYQKKGFEALNNRPHPSRGHKFEETFLNFLISEKNSDPEASIPEVIARAKEL